MSDCELQEGVMDCVEVIGKSVTHILGLCAADKMTITPEMYFEIEEISVHVNKFIGLIEAAHTHRFTNIKETVPRDITNLYAATKKFFRPEALAIICGDKYVVTPKSPGLLWKWDGKENFEVIHKLMMTVAEHGLFKYAIDAFNMKPRESCKDYSELINKNERSDTPQEKH